MTMQQDADIRERDDAPAATSKRLDADDVAADAGIAASGDQDVAQSVTINRPRRELFDFWRDFSNLARVMENVERVETFDGRRSHWTVKAPGGKTVEWDAVITDERPGESIAWQSEEGADVPNSGRISFRDAQGDRGTIVTAVLIYDPPAGVIGKVVAKLFQREPAIQARRDLRRFKQLMETGEIATNARNRAALEEEKE